MAQVLVGGGISAAITLNAFSLPLGGVPGFTPENAVARTIRVGGTFSNFGASFNANGTSRSINLRKNAANANQSVSPADSTAQIVYDTTDTDHYQATDTWDIKYNGAGTAYIPYFITLVFVADSGHVGLYAGAGDTAGTTATRFPCLGSFSSSTEALAQVTMRTSGTLQNLSLAVGAASTSTVTARSRKNGANGTLVVTIPANTTGVFDDATHGDTFVSGDLLNWQISGQSASFAWYISCAISYNGTTNEVLGSVGSTVNFSASDQFVPICAASGVVLTTESLVAIRHGFQVSTSNLRAVVATNSMTGTTTVRLRKNGADAHQTLSIGAGATGLFEDATNTDWFDATDTAAYVLRGGASGSILFNQIALTETPQGPPTGPGLPSFTAVSPSVVRLTRVITH